MIKYFCLSLLIVGLLLTGCGGNGDGIEPAAPVEMTTPPVINTLPPPDVAPAGEPQATQTFLPVVEASPSATAEPTAEVTPTPQPEPTATPQPLAPVSSIFLEPVTTGGMQQVTGLYHAFDERLFVLEQAGRIRIVLGGQVLDQPFLDITDRVGSSASEQGLLGLAFHPDYATPGEAGEGVFYVNYTDRSGDTRVSRFSVSADDPNRANPDSEVVYLTQDQPYPNHNGGSLAFGPDGYLYIGLGDGGSANDPLGAGQDLTTLLGKVLRIDVDSADNAYTVPGDNPFVGVEEARPEIWAYGLRNPWRFSFDRGTGDFYIADVGQNQWEEVNFQPAGSGGGENYGWVIMEGSHCFQANTCDQTGLVLPIFDYDHSNGCSITGGYVYRGSAFPAMSGNYFTADYCSGKIWRLFNDGGAWLADELLDSDLVISSFGQGADGELYALNYWNGGIYRVATDQ